MRPFRPLALVLCLRVTGLSAQEPVATDALRVFLDCTEGCDFDFLRREITWVNWMRNREDAQVHLLVTEQDTGGGGTEFTLRFLGLGGFQGRDNRLITTTPQTATDDEERRTLARAMRQGLVGYAATLGLAPRLDVVYQAPPGQQAGQAQRPRDPWNFWVFQIEVGGSFNGESRSKSSNVNGEVSARRITESWKLRFELDVSRNSNHFVFEDSTEETFVTSRSGAEVLAVRSLGPHWSVGVQSEFLRSDRENYDAAFRFAPGVEYNLWPYAQSSRRQLTFLYEIGFNAANYSDTTIFNKVKETRLDQRLRVALATREPWGTSEVSVEGATFLHDWSKSKLSFFGELELRVYKGLSLELFGGYSRIRNQLNISKEGATDEDVLLRLRELQTSYEYFVFVGVSYTFGSIYNNIVNPRFQN